MTKPALGIYFSVWTHQLRSLDDMAPIVAEAVGCPLVRSEERGVAGDYTGASFGIRLHFAVSPQNPAPPRSGTRYFLMGNSTLPEGTDVQWTDISAYISQLLTRQTGMTWDT